MKKYLGCAAIFFGFFCVVSSARISQNNIHGRWKAIRIDGEININMRIVQKREFGDWQYSRTFQESEFEGLVLGKDVNFRLVREAGTLSFDGDLSEEGGSGSFTFYPSLEFEGFLDEKGFRGVEDKELLMLCLNGLSRKYIDDLLALGYADIAFSDLISFAIHGVTIDFVKEIHALGYNNISPSKLISFRIHDVEPEYIKSLREFGYTNLDPDKLISFAIHGVTLNFVKSIHAAGYKDISPSDLISFRIHDVDKTFIDRMNDKWGKKLTPRKIISLKIQEF
jgi:hypothetical protein